MPIRRPAVRSRTHSPWRPPGHQRWPATAAAFWSAALWRMAAFIKFHQAAGALRWLKGGAPHYPKPSSTVELMPPFRQQSFAVRCILPADPGQHYPLCGGQYTGASDRQSYLTRRRCKSARRVGYFGDLEIELMRLDVSDNVRYHTSTPNMLSGREVWRCIHP
jgi:hypothetical protein